MEMNELELGFEQEKETVTIERERIVRLMKQCSFPIKLMEMMLESRTNSELIQFLFNEEIQTLLDLEDNFSGFLDYISFKRPSDYLEQYHHQNHEVNVASWVDRFQTLERIIYRICDSYRTNNSYLKINLERTFEQQNAKLLYDMMFHFKGMSQDEASFLTVFYINGVEQLSTIEEHIKTTFVETGIEKSVPANRLRYWDFRAMYEPDFFPVALIELVFRED